MSDFLTVLLARVDPAVARTIEPTLAELRAEYGGSTVYIASPRRILAQSIREALQVDSIARVAARYRISRRTAQRLARKT